MKRTQKELKPAIKKDVDAFVIELLAKYPEISKSSLTDYVKTELAMAMYEVREYDKVLTNRERWCV